MPLLLLAILTLVQGAQAVALPRAVPYLPQTEALCGGAAAAMVMRYWGADARAEDFAPLIDPAQDGIVTTALVADLRGRGWQAFPLRAWAERASEAPVKGAVSDVLRSHLSRGRPIVALIEDRPGRYHYVVITGVDDHRTYFHDPAIAPSQTMTHAEFERRWRAANFWMLLLLPPGTGTEPGERTEPGEPAGPEEPALAREVAELLRSGDTARALHLASDATKKDPASAIAWDALATALFVMDRDLAALDAWNRAGKPDVDTVQIGGLSRTRFRAAEALIGVESGERLTSGTLLRARRRLALLPAASAARVGYAPQSDGRVQIDAAIAERSRRPSFGELAIAAAKAPFSRDLEISFTNLVGGGERVIGSWRFREGFNRLEAAIAVPSPLPLGAVWRISGSNAQESFAPDGDVIESRWRRAALQVTDWLNGFAGWTAAAGFERWPEAEEPETRDKLYAALRGTIAIRSSFQAHVTAERWMRGAGASRLSARAQLTEAIAGGRLSVTAGAEGVRGRAPYFLYPGAGDGNLRAPLLRAHPLIGDDAIRIDRGQIFGRRLLQATTEWSRPIVRFPLATIDAAVFADAARGWQMLDGARSNHQIDAGAGLRFRVLGGGPAFRIDIARGLRDGRWALTAGTSAAFEPWIRR